MRIALVALAVAIPALALDCNEGRSNSRDGGSFCEMREQTLASSGKLNVDAGVNGGVSVKGWNRSDISMRVQVQTHASDDAAAKAMASQIRVDTSAGQIRAQGPEQRDKTVWSVSYELMVPNRIDLSLTTLNGGISVADVHGRIEFAATNGGVHLARLGGDVEGHTTNGGLTVELAGDRWDGTKLDAQTSNGGVTLRVPAQYSAHMETGTVNGNLKLDMPVRVSGDVSKRLSFDMGSGGPTIRVVTTNGSVSIRKT